MLGGPITATSANRSGQPSSSRVEPILTQIGGEIGIVLDAGPTPGGLPSTVLDVTSQPFTLIRAGQIRQKDLMEVCDIRVAGAEA